MFLFQKEHGLVLGQHVAEFEADIRVETLLVDLLEDRDAKGARIHVRPDVVPEPLGIVLFIRTEQIETVVRQLSLDGLVYLAVLFCVLKTHHQEHIRS